MGSLIDSSILIHFERSGADVSAYVKGREDEDAFLSVVSTSELLYGVHRAADRKTKAKRPAATCLAHGLRMATHNFREFERVPGLDVEKWE